MLAVAVHFSHCFVYSIVVRSNDSFMIVPIDMITVGFAVITALVICFSLKWTWDPFHYHDKSNIMIMLYRHGQSTALNSNGRGQDCQDPCTIQPTS